MGLSRSLPVLVAGLGLAVAIHARQWPAQPPQGPDLPALAEMSLAAPMEAGWSASAGLATSCPSCLPNSMGAGEALAAWPIQPEPAAAAPGHNWRIGLSPPATLDRLQSVPAGPGPDPLLAPGHDTSLPQGLRLDFTPAPEPEDWAMFVAGLALVGAQLRRRQRSYLATL